MSADAVRALVAAEIRRLREEADLFQRQGDLAAAAEVLYGQIPKLQTGLESLEHVDPVELTARHRMLTDGAGRVWVAFLLEDLDVQLGMEEDENALREGWMRLDEAFTLEERRRIILAQARRALLVGDRETANALETGALAEVESRLARQRCFDLLGEQGGRMLLRDGDGESWIAAPVETFGNG